MLGSQAFGLRALQRGREDLVARPSRLHLAPSGCPAAGCPARSASFRPLRRVGLVVLQHVRHLLRVGAEAQVGDPEVAVQQVAAVNDVCPCTGCPSAAGCHTDGWNQLVSPSCRDRSRIHHTTSSVVVIPGWMTAREKASAMMRVRDGDDLRVDLELLGRAPLEPADREPLGRLHAAGAGRQAARPSASFFSVAVSPSP